MTSKTPLRVGTRGSPLALWQARAVASLLEGAGILTALTVIATTGDRLQEPARFDDNRKRLFVKEIEDALLDGDIDLAVHSAKDMSSTLPEGLELAATLPRDDPRDAFVLPIERAGMSRSPISSVLSQLGPSPRVGTGSVRRIAQLAPLLPGASFVPIRGNVDTRVQKMDAGAVDMLVLASAGLHRLGLESRVSCSIPIATCVPAPGQGIIAIEIRTNDERTHRAVAEIHDPESGAALAAEQHVGAELGGDCQLPLGALAIVSGATLDLHAVVATIDGGRLIRTHQRGSVSDPGELGRRVAAALARDGAMEILDEVRQRSRA